MDRGLTAGTGADFDALAASIRADAGDLRTFLNVLAVKLEDALPGHVRIERSGALFARDRPVSRLEVTIGPRRYGLEWRAGELKGQVTPTGGSPQPAPLDQLIEWLARDVADQARTSSQARSAMDSLLAGQIPAVVVARAAGAEGLILWRHPDLRFSRASVVVVNPDEQVVIVHDGVVDGPTGPGRHDLGTIPLTGEDEVEALKPDFAAKLCFVLSREIPGLRFGGMVDKVLDPQTGLAVGLRIFGDYALRVTDPVVLVKTLGDTLETRGNAGLTDLVRDLLLRAIREHVVGHITANKWPILGLAARSAEIEAETLRAIQILAAGYGLELTRMGNFTISMKEEDEALVTAHIARHADAAPATAPCPSCSTPNPVGGRFCSNCGSALTAVCAGCGTANPAGAKFCSNCGKPLLGGQP